jgi:hypothetical protein
MTTGAYDAPRSSTAAEYRDATGTGWVAFAGIMLALAGTWNLFDGILALSNSKVYGANRSYVFSDLRTWGWIVLLLGVAQLLAAFAIFAGSEFARWFGIAVAGVNAIGQLAFVPVYPWWAVMMFAVDVLVIYGLARFAGKRLREDY